MNRTTIDFGIDLGTTNSAIAVLKGVKPEIIKNNIDSDVTPSAVSYDKKGTVWKGQRAKSRIEGYPKDTFLEFKRRMGTDYVYHFQSSGLTRKPEDLSAEILKELKGDAQSEFGETIDATVITVPAAFELHQCDATRKAGQLAGFRQSPLLQEPVAAALAYGFQGDQNKAYWLVYDFGGGTFDAAVMKSEEGIINVVNHGGDNFLGGSDIDWSIIEHILIPKLLQDYDLKEFKRGNSKWEGPLAKLKCKTETAKIELSRRDRTTLETIRFTTDEGEEIEFECDLTQNEVVRAAEPFILRSIEICEKVLTEKKLSRRAIEKVILVGGPTKAPYFRQLLAEKLQIPLEFSVDPLTVVAQGAAVFAGTQRLGAPKKGVAVAGEFTVELKYKPVGHDNEPVVGGKVACPGKDDLSDYSIEFIQNKTRWSSGRIRLKADGVFMTNLFAEAGDRNIYRIELTNRSGEKQKVSPDELAYTMGAVVEEQPLIHSIGVGQATNQVVFYFEKGRGLPQKKTVAFQTVQPLKLGQNGELIRIPIVEGENELADRNRLIDTIEIKASNIRREVPTGSEIELTLSIDTSRIVRAKAYVPILDEEFEAEDNDLKRTTPRPEVLTKECEAEMNRIRTLRTKAETADGQTNQEALDRIEASNLLTEIKETLPAAKGDPDAAAKCEKRLLELKLQLDELADKVEWPALVAEVREWIGYLESAAEKHATTAQRQKAERAIAEAEETIKEAKLAKLQRKLEQIQRAYYAIVAEQPGWWVFQLQQAEKQIDQMSDQKRGERLLNQGQECLAKNNVTGLQNVVRQLWDLLPSELAEAAKRGFQSGVVK